jgi:glycosyltransferase involved in cell wall biosynthesis
VASGGTIVLLSHWAPNLVLFRDRLQKELKARGWRVVAVAPSISSETRKTLQKLGSEVVEWPVKRNTLSPFGMLRGIHSLRRILSQYNPDVVIAYSHFSIVCASHARGLRGRWRFLPVVTGLGSLFTPTSRLSPRRLLRWILKREIAQASRRAKQMVLLNRDDFDEIRSWWGVARDRLVHLQEGEGVDLRTWRFDTELRQTQRKEWGIEEDVLAVGFLGRFLKDKGAGLFMLLGRRFKDEEGLLLVAAGGRDAANPSALGEDVVESFAGQHNCRVHGWLDDPKPMLSGLDLLVLPSVREGLPIVPLEAMACHTAVLATDVPGVREILAAEYGGRLIPAEASDPAALYEAWIRRLMDDRKLLKKWQEEGRAWVEERFDRKASVRRIVEWVEKG